MKTTKKDSLGNRMKRYEMVPKLFLTRRTPVIIRLDGKAFHTFTKGLKRPFDDSLIDLMQRTAKFLVKNIQGCSFAYTQSDEISLLLIDYQTLETDAWFDYNLEKIVSISSSMATAYFNSEKIKENQPLVFFDSRAFNIPKEDVTNYFIWRQQDCTRNSINMVGQYHFSHKELQNKNINEVQEMLFSKKGLNYNDVETHKKRGTAIINGLIDKEMPILTQDRNYVEQFVNIEKEKCDCCKEESTMKLCEKCFKEFKDKFGRILCDGGHCDHEASNFYCEDCFDELINRVGFIDRLESRGR